MGGGSVNPRLPFSVLSQLIGIAVHPGLRSPTLSQGLEILSFMGLKAVNNQKGSGFVSDGAFYRGRRGGAGYKALSPFRFGADIFSAESSLPAEGSLELTCFRVSQVSGCTWIAFLLPCREHLLPSSDSSAFLLVSYSPHSALPRVWQEGLKPSALCGTEK